MSVGMSFSLQKHFRGSCRSEVYGHFYVTKRDKYYLAAWPNVLCRPGADLVLSASNNSMDTHTDNNNNTCKYTSTPTSSLIYIHTQKLSNYFESHLSYCVSGGRTLPACPKRRIKRTRRYKGPGPPFCRGENSFEQTARITATVFLHAHGRFVSCLSDEFISFTASQLSV